MKFIKSYNYFSEAISISRYKEWSQWVNFGFYKKMENYFKKFDDHSNNYNRVYFDLKVDTDNFEIVIPDEITDFF